MIIKVCYTDSTLVERYYTKEADFVTYTVDDNKVLTIFVKGKPKASFYRWNDVVIYDE